MIEFLSQPAPWWMVWSAIPAGLLLAWLIIQYHDWRYADEVQRRRESIEWLKQRGYWH